MKTILFLLLAITIHPAFSQTWKKINIDEKVSISKPGETNRVTSGENIEISAITASGNLSIERFTLPDSIEYNDGKIDFLKYYSNGYIKGMEFSGKINKTENTSELQIDSGKVRSVLLKGNKENIIQIYFFVIDRKIYSIQFIENEAPSDSVRQKIFSSIQIK
ncbi:hypothetical protein [Marivirga sp.]|uniref:hypothetical protein n=1 Tax=Marivirga sp. TaxID=2018662 RepID=UPI0025D96AA8|nr:hypothetical protein [Marivirga sp.]